MRHKFQDKIQFSNPQDDHRFLSSSESCNNSSSSNWKSILDSNLVKSCSHQCGRLIEFILKLWDLMQPTPYIYDPAIQG